MNENQKQTLLKVARDTLEAVITQKEKPVPKSDDPELNSHCGCFVTLKNHDRLRGCIGRFISDIPLIELISEITIASATEDHRFAGNRIQASELNKLDIEISVLSPLKKTDKPLSLRLGIDGIYIKRGHAAGCFLPQVATETGWTKEEFLSYCCTHKAGLEPDAWKEPETEVNLFTAEVFGADFAKI
ncbi:MAG: AmmeMemoRadiSam system protein A [Sedimentisphaerales bacterium]|nr:AmmeMemoRadiSam system protein A [Sedimentisphaerales bacterium]